MTLFPIDPIEFTTAAPDSKKNSPRVITVPVKDGAGRSVYRDGRPALRYSVLPNPVALKQEAALHDYLNLALLGTGELPHFADHSVKVIVEHRTRADECDVIVEDLGHRPKGYTGRRRDLANLLEVILDAMQGPVYANDNQVAGIEMRRVLA